MLREPTAGSGKPRPRKTLPGSPDQGHEKNKRGRNRAGAARKNREEVEVLRGSLHGVVRVLQAAQLHLAAPMGATSCGQHMGLRARVVVLEGHERARQSELGFEQQNRFRNSRERQRIERKAFRARAGAAQSARQGGTEPGATRFRDGRRTTGPPAPRRGPGAPTAQPRARGPDLESAQVYRVAKFAILAPILDLNNETDLEACGTRAVLKRRS